MMMGVEVKNITAAPKTTETSSQTLRNQSMENNCYLFAFICVT